MQWSIDKKLQYLTESFNVALDRFAPHKKTSYFKKTWINEHCQREIRKKNVLFNKWIKNPTIVNHENYKKQRNLCDKTIRNAKISFYDQRTIGLGNSKRLFSTLRNLWSKERDTKTCKISATRFNEYFSSVGENLAKKFEKNLHINSSRVQNTFVFGPITTTETSKAIKNLKKSKSVCHDGISNQTFKQDFQL